MSLSFRAGIVLLCSVVVGALGQHDAENEMLDPGNMLHYDPTSQTMRKAAKTESREARKILPEEPEEIITWKMIFFTVVLAYLVYRLSSHYRHPNPPQLQQQQPQPNMNSGASAVVNAPQPAPNITQVTIKPGDKLAKDQPAKPTNNQQPQEVQTDSENEEQLDVEGRRPATNANTQDPKITKSHSCQPERKSAKMSPTSEASQAEAKPLDVNTSSVGEETKPNQPQSDEPQALRDDIVSSVTAFRDRSQPESAEHSSMPIYTDFPRDGRATESYPAENQPSHTDAQKLKDDTDKTPVQESFSPFQKGL